MSSPQTEDGYTRIANELLDAILRSPLSKRELNIVLAVIRKTYGYNKKSDDMTLTQLADLTSMKLSHVSETVAGLAAKNMLLKREGRYGYVLGINKKYSTWKCSQNGNVPKTGSIPSQNGNNDFPKREVDVPETGNTKDNSKRQSQKTTPKEREHAPGLDVSAWEQWVEYRRAIKKPIKPVSEEMAQKALAKFGPDQMAVVGQSIANSWQGLFPVKGEKKPRTQDPFAGAI